MSPFYEDRAIALDLRYVRVVLKVTTVEEQMARGYLPERGAGPFYEIHMVEPGQPVRRYLINLLNDQTVEDLVEQRACLVKAWCSYLAWRQTLLAQ